RAGFVAEAEHSDGIASFVLTDDAPLSWDAFARGMETLIALRGPDLLRVKGLLNVAGCRGPVVVHVVQHLAHPPAELAAWPGNDPLGPAGVHPPPHFGTPSARPPGLGARVGGRFGLAYSRRAAEGNEGARRAVFLLSFTEDGWRVPVPLQRETARQQSCVRVF